MEQINGQELKDVKDKLNNVFSKRTGYGAINKYSTGEHAYINNPSEPGVTLENEFYKKIVDPMLTATDVPGFILTKQSSSKQILDKIITRLNTMETENTKLSDPTYKPGSCRGACTGFCFNSCIKTCHSDCYSGCHSGCKTGCNGCTNACTGTCGGTCSGCSGCTGCNSCTSNCTSNCSGCSYQ